MSTQFVAGATSYLARCGKRVHLNARTFFTGLTLNQQDDLTQKPNQVKDEAIQYTTSSAHLNYKAVRNFYGDDRVLPKSHNLVLFCTFATGLVYCIFIREDIDDNEGFKALLKPPHETIPRLAIPLLESALMEARKTGNPTMEIQKKLDEYYKEPEKYGGVKRRIIINKSDV